MTHEIIQSARDIEGDVTMLLARMYDVSLLTTEPLNDIIKSWREHLVRIRSSVQCIAGSLRECELQEKKIDN